MSAFSSFECLAGCNRRNERKKWLDDLTDEILAAYVGYIKLEVGKNKKLEWKNFLKKLIFYIKILKNLKIFFIFLLLCPWDVYSIQW